MPGPARLCRRLVASTRAIAAIEFAIVMPVLALMFFGTFDAGRAIAIYMKIRSATFAIDAITNQYTTVQTSDLQSIAGAAAVISRALSELDVRPHRHRLAGENHRRQYCYGKLELLARRQRALEGVGGDHAGHAGHLQLLSVLPDLRRDELPIYADVRVFHDRGEYYTFRQPVCDPAQQQVRAVPDGRRQQLLTRPPGKSNGRRGRTGFGRPRFVCSGSRMRTPATRRRHSLSNKLTG